MEALIILFSVIAILLFIFLAFQIIRIYRHASKLSAGDMAKDIFVIKFPGLDLKSKNPMEMPPPAFQDNHGLQGEDSREKRAYPREKFEEVVDFIKEGRLYKETSRDLSYSGIFLKSSKPDQYRINDTILLTFHPPKGQPQKRNGRVVRKDPSGVGVQFTH